MLAGAHALFITCMLILEIQGYSELTVRTKKILNAGKFKCHEINSG